MKKTGSARATPQEAHLTGRGGWLRAAVLGANDGVVSTASLIIGVASASVARGPVVIAGIAGVVAGALSMAAGEYVSVSSQRDVEQADIEIERRQLQENPEVEMAELVDIYVPRGLDPELARKVAEQLSARDRLQTHLRDELGLHESTRARPMQAALVSAASFSSLAICPILGFWWRPPRTRSGRSRPCRWRPWPFWERWGRRWVVPRARAARCGCWPAADSPWRRAPSSVACWVSSGSDARPTSP